MTLRVGIMAMGGRHWIAGVQYLHGLLYGNSLLPTEECGALRLYLDFADHRISDYRAVRRFADAMRITEFWPAAPWRVYRNLSSVTGIILRERRWPGWPVLGLPEALKKDGIDVLFAGNIVRPDLQIAQISWIPDFQHLHLPELFSTEERRNRDALFARIMAEADRVIVSNQCSYAEAAQLYPQYCQKLAVLPFTMYLGENWRKPDPQNVVLRYQLPPKFLFFPSQIWRHKNHETALRAVKLLRDRGLNDVVLVCSGLAHDPRYPNHIAELRDWISKHNLDAAVRFLGLLPRQDQVQLMRAAAAILQPSLFEGWSAVVEEGRSLGKIIFASDIPMHREQLADGMHLFPPTSAEALADLISQHWPKLRPGPDPQVETAAEIQYHDRIRNFARQFIRICRGLGPSHQ